MMADIYVIHIQGKNQLFFQGINQTRMHICEIVLSCILLAFATASPIPDEIQIAGNYAQVYQSIELFGACKTLIQHIKYSFNKYIKIFVEQVRKSEGSKQLLADETNAASSKRFLQPEFVGSGRSLGFEFPEFDPSFSTSQTYGRSILLVPMKDDERIEPTPVYVPPQIV